MKNAPLRIVGLALGLLLVPCAAAQSPSLVAPIVRPEAQLKRFIEAQMKEGHMPGLAAAIVKGDKLVWARGYGLADISNNVPVTEDTLFMIASISKTITATALMQQFDQGKFQLDDDISNSLPFAVTHPGYPAETISFRELLCHVAGLKDNWAYMPYSVGDHPTPLGYFCEQYLTPGGIYYDATKNFQTWAPGAAYSYANCGFALVGFLTEAITGIDFDDYCQANLFAPLGMTESSFRLSKLDVNKIAIPYSWNGTDYTAHQHYGYPDYPDGCLRTSVVQLANFMIAHMNDGDFHGTQILSPQTTAEMHTLQYPGQPGAMGTQALAFYLQNPQQSPRIGHNGGDQGVSTDMWWIPSREVGVIVFLNGDTGYPQMKAIVDRLFQEAKRF